MNSVTHSYYSTNLAVKCHLMSPRMHKSLSNTWWRLLKNNRILFTLQFPSWTHIHTFSSEVSLCACDVGFVLLSWTEFGVLSSNFYVKQPFLEICFFIDTSYGIFYPKWKYWEIVKRKSVYGYVRINFAFLGSLWRLRAQIHFGSDDTFGSNPKFPEIWKCLIAIVIRSASLPIHR